MFRKLLRGKIHGAIITGADLHYEGSISIDVDLLDASGIAPFESVHVWNVTNGERFETYAIESPSGSGEILVNGAAARRAQVGDQVIIAAYAWLTAEDLASHKPKIVLLQDRNRSREQRSKVQPASGSA